MPKGNPTSQTIASEKYQKKAGYMTKSFKLKRDIVEQFEQACKDNDEPQSVAITNFMRQYIEQKK